MDSIKAVKKKEKKKKTENKANGFYFISFLATPNIVLRLFILFIFIIIWFCFCKICTVLSVFL